MKSHSSVSQYYEALEALQKSNIDDRTNENFHNQHTHDTIRVNKTLENPYFWVLAGTLIVAVITNLYN